MQDIAMAMAFLQGCKVTFIFLNYDLFDFG